MTGLPDLSRRWDGMEVMDRPGCDPRLARRAFTQFRWMNVVLTASRRLIRQHLFPACVGAAGREFAWLDVGGGCGDILRWVVRVARRRGWRVRATLLDRDPAVAEWAREDCRAYPEIAVVTGAAEKLPALGTFDFIISNHLLHHLPEAAVSELLRRCDAQARLGFLMNDLRRSAPAYAAFRCLGALLLHDSYALPDGLLSLRRAFRPAELRALLPRELAARGVQVLAAAPARLLVVRPAAAG